MLRNSSIFFLIVVLSLSLFGLIRTKMYVHELDIGIRDMKSSKSLIIAEIQVLKAEWSYLNRAERLSELNDKYLGLKKIASHKINKLESSGSSFYDGLIVVRANTYDSPKKSWKYRSRDSILQKN